MSDIKLCQYVLQQPDPVILSQLRINLYMY